VSPPLLKQHESLNPLISAEPIDPMQFPNSEDWLKSDFQNPKFFVIRESKPTSEALYVFDYTSILLRGSGASLPVLEKRLPYTKDAFDTCQVQIQSNWIIVVDPPEDRVDFVHDHVDFDYSNGTKAHLALITPPVEMPALFYIKSFTNTAAVTGTSAAPHWAGGSPQENFTWVTEPVLNYFAFSVEAHELGHVLADMGHGPAFTGNLMSAGPYRNNRFPKWDCERIWTHPLVRKI